MTLNSLYAHVGDIDSESTPERGDEEARLYDADEVDAEIARLREEHSALCARVEELTRTLEERDRTIRDLRNPIEIMQESISDLRDILRGLEALSALSGERKKVAP